MFADTVADEIVSDSQREWGRGSDLAVTAGALNAGAGGGRLGWFRAWGAARRPAAPSVAADHLGKRQKES